MCALCTGKKLYKRTAGTHTSHIHIVLSIVKQSCISSFHWTHVNTQLNAHTHTQRSCIHTKRFRSCVWRQEAKVEGLNQQLLPALPSSCATRCLHSRALRASPGINDHYGSIRAATRRSLCYTEKNRNEDVSGGPVRGETQTEWEKDITLSHPATPDVLTDKQQSRSSESAS